jgi:branched-subunit amino acid ABC-type transport system permease component
MEYFALLLSSGLVVGAVYGLVGMGFAIIYKATGIVNFAQGELLMLTAYIAFSIAQSLSLSFLPDAGRAGLLDRDGDGGARRDPAWHHDHDLGTGPV